MPTLLSILLAVSLIPISPATEDDEGTVRLLVREDARHRLPAAGVGADDVSIGRSSGWIRVEVPIEGSIEETAAALSEATGTQVMVEQRYPLLGPTDEPLFNDQWYHQNTGQTNGRSDADIDSPTAWARALGAGITVAVVDSGVDMAHPDLSTQIWANTGDPAGGGDNDGNGFVDDFRGWDFVSNDNNPSPVGTSGSAVHGTAVAGLISGASNGTGLVGVAPSSEVMVIRACDSAGCFSLDAAEAIYYAAEMGARVINLSFGGVSQGDPPLEDAIAFARSRDVLVVAAAGNETRNLDQMGPSQQFVPAGLPFSNIIAVAASDDDDNLASFSNFGPQTVDIAAPGEAILTTGLTATNPYVFADGTSFSAPLVAGAAALLLSHDPEIGHQELAARLTGFADQPGGVAGATGFGRLNIGRSVTLRFIDTSGSEFVTAIDWLASENITQGCNPPANHRFCPDDPVSRGEMAVFLAKAFDLPGTGTDYFDDDDGTFFEFAANSLAAAGLTVGCGTRRYCGNEDIRRDEMAAMLARALDLPTPPEDFFVDDTGSVFEGVINEIAEAGITKGCNPPANSRYCPTSRVTRGQMAVFINRSVDLL
ncbi:MAG TPA: S8 family serine peptidase, partial [Acidimicrobiia bacterium]|nr:S8 family serine peptidase [Acidimicrobiia bacterium]